jgi:L-iditol 2-dehydrogenase
MKGQRVVWPSQATVEIEDFDIPAVGDNEILVETECSLISPGTERAFLLGLPNAQGSYPSRPGYSNIGRVVEVGANVKDLAVGARVASSMGHTSHFVASRERVIKVTEPSAPPEEVVFFNLCTISLQGIRKARVELGEPVLVLGQGLIGLLAMQLARIDGGLPTIAVDLTDSRLELAKRVGADYALNPKADNFKESLAAATNGKGAAVVIEATGHPDAVNTAFDLAGWCGRVVLLASTRGETEAVNFYRDVHKKGLTVFGAHNGIRPRQESSPHFWTSRDDWELSLQLIAHKRIDVAPLTTHRLRGTDAPEAYRLLMEWDPGLLGVVLEWGS